MADSRPIIVAVTGASGAVYAAKLVDWLATNGHSVWLTVSEYGRQIMSHELGSDFRESPFPVSLLTRTPTNIAYFPPEDMSAPMASGSVLTRGMAVVPCSMGSLGRIASGISSNLIERAADVTLKERRPLVICPRETPLNLVHLENMAGLTRAGATVLPACPAFYSAPSSIDDLVDFVVMRVLDSLGIDNDLQSRWK